MGGPVPLLGVGAPPGGEHRLPPTLLSRLCRPGCEEKAKPQNSRKIGPAGGGQQFPSALHSWAVGRAPAPPRMLPASFLCS